MGYFILTVQLHYTIGDSNLDIKIVRNLKYYINKHYNEKISVNEISKSINVSERECYRIFNKYFKMTVSQYLLRIRMQHSMEMLAGSTKSISEIAYETGFGTSSYFGYQFKKYNHITPKDYRNNCKIYE